MIKIFIIQENVNISGAKIEPQLFGQNKLLARNHLESNKLIHD